MKNFGRPVMRRVHKRASRPARPLSFVLGSTIIYLNARDPRLAFCCTPSKQHRLALTTPGRAPPSATGRYGGSGHLCAFLDKFRVDRWKNVA
jgi:hypothetical protein